MQAVNPRWDRVGDRPLGGACVSYLTDGVHLYESLGSCQNFGLAGGNWLTVQDCRTNTVRTMSQLEQALCESVPGHSASSH
jgi:hypothetical protein